MVAGRDFFHGARSINAAANGAGNDCTIHMRQINYAVVSTRNLESVRRFYEDLMEFSLVRTLGLAPGAGRPARKARHRHPDLAAERVGQ
jgi:hypothetical protein